MRRYANTRDRALRCRVPGARHRRLMPPRPCAASTPGRVAARCTSQGTLRDGGTVTAAGLAWHVPALPAGDRLLSFEVGLRLERVPRARDGCRTAADTTATPFAARRYVVGHADTGRCCRLTETATEVDRDRPGDVHVPGRPRVCDVHRPRPRSRAYRAGRAPASAFVNGTAGAAHRLRLRRYFARLAATLRQRRRHAGGDLPHRRRTVDGRCPRSRLVSTGTLRPGRAPRSPCAPRTPPARACGRSAGGWCRCRRRPPACPGTAGACWYPPHLDRTGRPMRWDWQIGRVTPLERTGRAGGRHLRHRRLPDHAGRDHARCTPRGRQRPCPTRRRSATSTWPGRTTGPTRARSAAAARFPVDDARQGLLRLPAGALARRSASSTRSSR